MGCGESKDVFQSRELEERVVEALKQEGKEGQVVKVAIEEEEKRLVDFLLIPGAVCWVEDAKPYQGAQRVYRDGNFVCSRYV